MYKSQDNNNIMGYLPVICYLNDLMVMDVHRCTLYAVDSTSTSTTNYELRRTKVVCRIRIRIRIHNHNLYIIDNSIHTYIIDNT